MTKSKFMRGVLLSSAFLLGLGNWVSAQETVGITNVRMVQRDNSRMVDIYYTLDRAAIITLSVETNGVSIGDSHLTRLTGDVCKLIQPGERMISWNAGEDWNGRLTANARPKITAWSKDDPPLYCAIDLSSSGSATNYPTYYYTSAEAVPNGVTDDLYKTTCILMRRISPTGSAGFKMGSHVQEVGRWRDKKFPNVDMESWHDVVLTKPYYIGIYEITQSQWAYVMAGTNCQWPSSASALNYRLTRPVENVSMIRIREIHENNYHDHAVDWPLNNTVYTNSFMGRLRTKLGSSGLDLPTEAQWEYACRAGTTGAFNDGTVNLTNGTFDVRLDPLARYRHNSNFAKVPEKGGYNLSDEYGPAKVGSYRPNAWGLYDMHGNVQEICLDHLGIEKSGQWDAGSVGDLGKKRVVDPVGPVHQEGADRWFIARGGAYNSGSGGCRSAVRSRYKINWGGNNTGFRLVWNLQ